MTYVSLSLFSTALTSAEEFATVKARVWPAQTTLGQELHLVIEAEAPPGSHVLPLPEKINVAPFELRRTEILSGAGGNARTVFALTLAVFDLGDQRIPPVPVRYKDASGQIVEVMTDPQTVKVVEVKKRPGDKDDIRPIKGPVSMDLRRLRALLLGAAALFLTLFLTVKIILRRRRKVLEDLESRKPPHERAMIELERLQRGPLSEEGKFKEYYSELADILRRYISRRYEFNAMDLTTFELVQELQKRSFERPLVEKVKHFLDAADLIKFAKFVPPRSLASQLVQQLTVIVDDTKPVPEETDKGKRGRK